MLKHSDMRDALEKHIRNSDNSNKSAESGIMTLSDLVKDNLNNAKLKEIKEVVLQAKAIHGLRWAQSDNRVVECAVRDAIFYGQEETVTFFLNEGISPDTLVSHKEKSGHIVSYTAIAAEVGNLAMVRLLVAHGADIKPRNNYNNTGDDTTIIAAVKAGQVDIVDYLLEQGANANASYDDVSLLEIAAQDGNVRIVESLIKHGANIKNAILSANTKGGNLLNKYRDYIESNYSESHRNFRIKHGMDIDEFDRKKLKAKKACDEMKNQYSNAIKLLLDYAIGIDFPGKIKNSFLFNECDFSGFNAIGMSIEGRPITPITLVRICAAGGADKALLSKTDCKNMPDVPRGEALLLRLDNCIRTQGALINDIGIVNLVPLWVAAEIGDINAVTTRLRAGVNPNSRMTEGLAPIILAARNNHPEIVKILAKHEQIDKTTFIQAAEEARAHQHEAIATFLTDQLDINAVDKSGNARLHIAVSNRDITEVKALLGKGADVNLENEKGLTPLLMAASTQLDPEVAATLVEILLQNKADANRYKGKSPLSCAVRQGNLAAAALLLPHTEKRSLIYKEVRDEKMVEISIPWYVEMMFDALYKENNIKLLSLLKASGADFNAQNRQGSYIIKFCYPGITVEQFRQSNERSNRVCSRLSVWSSDNR